MKIGIRHPLAVMVLALLGAGCADQPQQAGQTAAAQPAAVAATTPAAPPAAGDDAEECEDQVSTGTMITKKHCTSATERAQQQQQAQSFLQQNARQNQTH